MAQLGANALGEVLEPGRVPDRYLGLRLDPPAAEVPKVPVVAPASLLHPAVPQPDGTVPYELLTGHPRPDTAGAGVPDRPGPGVARLADRHLGQGRG